MEPRVQNAAEFAQPLNNVGALLWHYYGSLRQNDQDDNREEQTND
jgi:hypothetical protein